MMEYPALALATLGVLMWFVGTVVGAESRTPYGKRMGKVLQIVGLVSILPAFLKLWLLTLVG